MTFSPRLVGLLGLIRIVSAYTWPNPKLDELESLLYDQFGFLSHGGIVASALAPCDTFNFGQTVNRSNAADWIRTVRRLFYRLFQCSLHIRTIFRRIMTWLRTILKMAPAGLTPLYSLNSTETKYVYVPHWHQ